jgi:hypothetical protein
LDLEKELDNICHPEKKKSSNRSMDLCSSLEDMAISPSPQRRHEDDEEECEKLLYVIKR